MLLDLIGHTRLKLSLMGQLSDTNLILLLKDSLKSMTWIIKETFTHIDNMMTIRTLIVDASVRQ